jgi:hypothetical protein
MASSTIVARGAQVTRPQAVTAAVVITVVTALATFPSLFLPGTDEVPAAAIGISIIASLVMLVAAWGLWQLRRWGAVITFALTLLSVLSSIPAFIERPSGWIVASAAVGVPIGIVVLVLIALPSSRRVYR